MKPLYSILSFIFSYGFSLTLWGQPLPSTSFGDDFSRSHLWEEIYSVPLNTTTQNLIISYGDITINNEEVDFNDLGGHADKRIYRKIGSPLSNNWIIDFDFKPTSASSAGVTGSILAVTAGTKHTRNDVPETVTTSSPSFPESDQDGISVEYLCPLYGNSSTYFIRLLTKDGSSTHVSNTMNPAQMVYIPTGSTTYYLRLKRDGDDITFYAYTDPSRESTYLHGSISVDLSDPTINQSITGLHVIQHGNLPNSYYQRRLSATLDNLVIKDSILSCVSCADAPLNLSDQNYVKTETVRQPVQTDSQVDALSNGGEKWVDIRYIDGFGRPLQEVSVQAAPNCQGDLIQYHQYDSLGREAKVALPFAHDLDSLGSLREDSGGGHPQTLQQNFYQTYFSHLPTGDQNTPYAITQFESSPLNRALEQGFPGADWQPNAATTSFGIQQTGEHTRISQSLVNDTTEEGFAQNASVSATLYTFDPGELHIQQSTDENGHITEVATDLFGRQIFQRV